MRWLPIAILLVLSFPIPIRAQESRVRELEQRVASLERDRARGDVLGTLGGYAASGFWIGSIALYCALWARSTGRDFWLWLAGGLVFNVLALLAIWSTIDAEHKASQKIPPAPEL